MKTAAEIVNYLIRHYQEKSGEISKNLLSDKINDLTAQMGRFLENRLEQETPYKVVWDEFKRDPEEISASLSGILEALFEAQPSVRDRVNGFMRKITAIEVKQSNIRASNSTVSENLKSIPGGVIMDDGEISQQQTAENFEKNPPTYLYGNERPGFESSPQAPVSQAFMVGENAQIVFNPASKVQFPSLFDHLAKLIESSKEFTLDEKRKLQENLQVIHFQLTGIRTFQQKEVAQSIEKIWETSPSIADALIESLQSDLGSVPKNARGFIIQLQTPLH